MKVYIFLLIISVFFLTLIQEIKAQNNEVNVENTVTDCESNKRDLDTAYNVAKDGEVIILISRLGKKENKGSLHWKRLNNVINYYKEAWKNTSKEIVAGIGKKVSGNGRIEVYADGKLIGLLIVKKNDPLSLRCYDSSN